MGITRPLALLRIEGAVGLAVVVIVFQRIEASWLLFALLFRMQTYVELWGVFSGNVGNPPIKAGGRGASGGLEMRFGAQSSFWGRLGYGLESLHADALRETAEVLTLSVVYGLPQ